MRWLIRGTEGLYCLDFIFYDFTISFETIYLDNIEYCHILLNLFCLLLRRELNNIQKDLVSGL